METISNRTHEKQQVQTLVSSSSSHKTIALSTSSWMDAMRYSEDDSLDGMSFIDRTCMHLNTSNTPAIEAYNVKNNSNGIETNAAIGEGLLPSQETVPRRLIRHVYSQDRAPVQQSISRLWAMQSLYLSRTTRQIWKPLNQITEYEGISLSRDCTTSDWPRDQCFLLDHPSKSILVPLQDICEPVILKERISSLMRGSWANCPEVISCGYHRLKSKTVRRLNVGSERITMARCYFEGGNVLPADRDGERVYIVGSANLWATVLVLQQFLRTPDKFEIDLADEIEQAMRECQSDIDPLGENKEVQSMLRHLHEANELETSLPTKDNLSHLRELLALFRVAQRFFVEDFGTPCVFAGYDGGLHCTQLDFHLDLYMTCLPGGVILLQDHAKCIEALKKAKAQVTSREDNFQLNLTLLTAGQLQKKFKKSLDRLEDQLHDAGFQVIRVPGQFQQTQKQSNINYMNSLAFVSGNDDRACLIVPKYAFPMEHVLRSAFIESLRDTSVGRVWTLTPDERKRGNEFSRSIQLNGSLHCRTQNRYGSIDRL